MSQQLDQLTAQLDRLAELEPGPYPVVSLYLNLQADQHGRDNFEPFLRKELSDRIATYATSGPERESLERDAEKIRAHVASVDPSVNGLAIFSSSGADLFEAVEMAAPVAEHRLYVSGEPHVYPLARLMDDYPRYAVLLADTNTARIFVFALNALEDEPIAIEGTKTRRHKMGGWSQARYQRHVENYHVKHAKEVLDVLERTVVDEGIRSIVIAGDPVIVPLLREQMSKEVSERIIDVVKLDIRANLRDVVDKTIASMRGKDAEGDQAAVDALIGAYRGNGLGVVGVEATRRALDMGQVDELLVTGSPETIKAPENEDSKPSEPSAAERTADELLVKARQTAARVRIIQDASLLAGVGGVGALLRFKL